MRILPYKKYRPWLKEKARERRRDKTLAEQKMWGLLRKKRTGFKFTREKPMDRFILDFYCSKLLLAIEVDGAYHFSRLEYDFERDNHLKKLDILTIRFTNEQVLYETRPVEKRLVKIINQRANFLKSKSYANN